MATEIKIPRIGMAVADATLIEWQCKEGEQVKESQVVAIIETEKVRSDVESPTAGLLHILLKEGETAPPGKAIGMLAETKEELEALQQKPTEEAPTKAAEVAEAPKAEAAIEATPPKEAVATRRGEERIRISPVARKLA